ncbi:MAG: cation transporter [Eubacterium sp.]|nr:cation transporter [Eubacterium sp.]
MKKKYVLTDLCCANCALKIEEGIKKIPGVNDASVSFITSKMILDAEDERFDEIFAEAVKIVKKIEPDCEVLKK